MQVVVHNSPKRRAATPFTEGVAARRRSPIPRLSAVAVAAAALLAVTGCGGGDDSVPKKESTRLDGLLVDQVQGFVPGPAKANGAMPRSTAAKATVVPPKTMESFLKKNDYQGGYSRVWKQDDEELTTLVLAFKTPEQAKAMVAQAQKTVIDQSIGTYADPIADIPDSTAYFLSGTRRADKSTLFCAGVWFSVKSDVYHQNLCAARPMGVPNLAPVSEQQYVRVKG